MDDIDRSIMVCYIAIFAINLASGNFHALKFLESSNWKFLESSLGSFHLKFHLFEKWKFPDGENSRGGGQGCGSHRNAPLPVVGARIVLRPDGAHTRGLRPVS